MTNARAEIVDVNRYITCSDRNCGNVFIGTTIDGNEKAKIIVITWVLVELSRNEDIVEI